MIETCNVLHCKFCEQVFMEADVLRVHAQIEHLHKNKTWYRCDICCDEIFLQIQCHMSRKHNRQDFEKEALIVNGIEDITYPCGVCGVLCVLSKFCKKHMSESSSLYKLNHGKATVLDAMTDCTNHEEVLRLFLESLSRTNRSNPHYPPSNILRICTSTV
uniref:C2H2-type domain-containing protein n=1 Tax=Cacopsylla melanoneura TaxID=428564 RepID=A0A8D8RQQ8_9HEMI